MNLGTPELLLILMVVLLLFGAKRLPELGRGLGTAVREFRRGAREAEEEPELSASEPPASAGDNARPRANAEDGGGTADAR